jgi:hypothetical protein
MWCGARSSNSFMIILLVAKFADLAELHCRQPVNTICRQNLAPERARGSNSRTKSGCLFGGSHILRTVTRMPHLPCSVVDTIRVVNLFTFSFLFAILRAIMIFQLLGSSLFCSVWWRQVLPVVSLSKPENKRTVTRICAGLL